MVGVHRVTIAHIERGDAASLDLAHSLSSALGRSLEWLMDKPEKDDQVSLAREALSDSLNAVAEAADRLSDLMAALDGRVRETVAEQSDRKVEVRA